MKSLEDGDLALIDGAYDYAIRMYNNARESVLEPHEHARALGHRGTAYMGLNEIDKAREDFQAACAIEPENLRWKYKLAICHQRGGNFDVLNSLKASEHPWISSLVDTSLTSSKSKLSFDWYQTDSHLFISVFIREATSCQAVVDQRSNTLKCPYQCKNETQGSFQFHLADRICPNPNKKVKSKVNVQLLEKKIEITLEKEHTGKRWSVLEKIESQSAEDNRKKSKVKNWDEIVTQLDEENEEEQSVDNFFKQIYAGSSEETRRAMMKSYQESGGTVLSTNWEDVSKKRVDVQTPDGMEFRKWN